MEIRQIMMCATTPLFEENGTPDSDFSRCIHTDVLDSDMVANFSLGTLLVGDDDAVRGPGVVPDDHAMANNEHYLFVHTDDLDPSWNVDIVGEVGVSSFSGILDETANFGVNLDSDVPIRMGTTFSSDDSGSAYAFGVFGDAFSFESSPAGVGLYRSASEEGDIPSAFIRTGVSIYVR